MHNKTSELDLTFISDRGDMTKPDNFYDCHPMKRTLEEMQEMAKMRPGENYCCVHQPLLNLPVDHIILDELHLMLRITDILINNLISDAMQWDEKDDIRKTRNVPKGEYLKRKVTTLMTLQKYYEQNFAWACLNIVNDGHENVQRSLMTTGTPLSSIRGLLESISVTTSLTQSAKESMKTKQIHRHKQGKFLKTSPREKGNLQLLISSRLQKKKEENLNLDLILNRPKCSS